MTYVYSAAGLDMPASHFVVADIHHVFAGTVQRSLLLFGVVDDFGRFVFTGRTL